MGFCITFNSFGHIATRQKPGTKKKFIYLHEQFQEVFQLQKDQIQDSTTPHYCIATRLTRLGTQPRLEPANSLLGVRHRNHKATANPKLRSSSTIKKLMLHLALFYSMHCMQSRQIWQKYRYSSKLFIVLVQMILHDGIVKTIDDVINTCV